MKCSLWLSAFRFTMHFMLIRPWPYFGIQKISHLEVFKFGSYHLKEESYHISSNRPPQIPSSRLSDPTNLWSPHCSTVQYIPKKFSKSTHMNGITYLLHVHNVEIWHNMDENTIKQQIRALLLVFRPYHYIIPPPQIVAERRTLQNNRTPGCSIGENTVMSELQVERIYYLVDTGYLALISAVIIMVYVLMIEKLVDQRRHPTASSASAKKPEIRLAIIGLILSICLIFMTFRSIIKGFDDDIFDTDFGAFISRLLFSIFNLSNPYMLVISSKPMRTELFNLVTCQKFRKPVEPVKFSQVFATSNSDNNFRAISRHSSHAAERSSIAASAHQRRDSPGSVQMTNNTGSLKS